MSLRKTLKRWLGEVSYRLRPGQAEYSRALPQAEFQALGPGDLVIDCGANLGAVTLFAAARGAEVHAFEPNPDAFAILSRRTSGMAGVHLHPQAVLDAPGLLPLYLHLNYARNPERFSSGSSLLAEKRNVDEGQAVEVPVIDLAAFIAGLGRPVTLLKLDIEGAEYKVLNALIDRGVMGQIGKVFVETHAGSIPALTEADAALRARIAAEGLGEKIDLNWT